MTTPSSLFATVALGLEDALAAELEGLGASEVTAIRSGVSFVGDLETAYRVCLWSRLASRVLLPIARFPALTPEALYDGVRTVDWSEHLGVDGTLAVDFTSTRSAIRHTNYGALKTKDAIVDQFREVMGRRPSVDTTAPDVRVNVHVHDDEATVSVDLSGGGLHRRGWRGPAGRAPLKETLAAGILAIAGWPETAARGGGFVDPMCGSGTLPIEAALMAADVAPGLLRERFGAERWRGHDPAIWRRLISEARERDRRETGRLPRIVGYDTDAAAVHGALENIDRAGLRGLVHIERRRLDAAGSVGDRPGLVVLNPPYGERLGEVEPLQILYRQIGDALKQRYPGWRGFVLAGNPGLIKFIGLRVARRHVLFNGPIECRLLDIPIHPAAKVETARVETAESSEIEPPTSSTAAPASPTRPAPESGSRLSGPVVAFANRLRKNLTKIRRWARREGVTCYRIYDADLPEYALDIDLYEGWVHIQEREPPRTIDRVVAVKRLNDALLAVQEVLGVEESDIFLKRRRHQRGSAQYRKLADWGELREVREGGHRFYVNLRDYFDTGLFLDHRKTRALIGELAPGRRFLNLFAYTGAATVYAAKAGATSTMTVDLSNTYTAWAKRNLSLNRINPDRDRRHSFVRADCLDWIERERGRFGLIFLDPPTFSNSKGMRGTFDVQRDHVPLIRAVVRLLEPDGVLLFSNNFRRFQMDREALSGLVIQDITQETMPQDFARSPRVHNAWRITRQR